MKNSIRKVENDLIEVVNRQRKIKISLKIWRDFTFSAADEIGEASGKSLTVAFVSDKKIRQLNNIYRGVNVTTDVLSFHNEPSDLGFEIGDWGLDGWEKGNPNSEIPIPKSIYLGDIVISLEQAQRQALENNLDFETEIKQLILHGILHLCGYDHETDDGGMNERELELRDKLGI